MDDLSLLFPQPEVVTLGGEPLLAVCFQLRDLARLQQIAKGLKGDPLANRRTPLVLAKLAAGGDYLGDSPESRAYAELLRPAIRAVADWPPILGRREADELLGTPAGRVLWLDVLLARTNPGFTAATAAELFPRATAEELLILEGIAYADHPGDFLNRLADPMPRRRGKPVKWGEAIVEAVRETGLSFETMGALYLSQWYTWRAGGKLEPGMIPGDRARVRAVTERRRRLMGGPTAESNGTGH